MGSYFSSHTESLNVSKPTTDTPDSSLQSYQTTSKYSRLLIHNLPYRFTESKMKKLLRKHGFQVSFANIKVSAATDTFEEATLLPYM